MMSKMQNQAEKHIKKNPSCLMFLEYVRQEMERREAGDRWELYPESQTRTSPGARQVAEVRDVVRRGEGWGTLLPFRRDPPLPSSS